MAFTVTFEEESLIHTLLVILHHELARTEGLILLAEDTIEDYNEGLGVGGRQRDAAYKHLREKPAKAERIRKSQAALKQALKESRTSIQPTQTRRTQ